jgi:hypothetical protein
MSDYAGAVAAIKTKFVTDWGSTTRVAFVNQTPAAPWPPRNGSNALEPWVLLSIEGAGAAHPGFGTPGNQVYLYNGLIYIHVYIPVGNDVAAAQTLAVAAGEIFRAQKLYDNGDGCYVRTWTPRVDGGGPGSDDGVWFRVTAAVPFEYWHRG